MRRSTSTARSTGRQIASNRTFFRHFVNMSFADRPATVLVTHSMAFVVIILAFLSREFVQTRKKGREAGAG